MVKFKMYPGVIVYKTKYVVRECMEMCLDFVVYHAMYVGYLLSNMQCVCCLRDGDPMSDTGRDKLALESCFHTRIQIL